MHQKKFYSLLSVAATFGMTVGILDAAVPMIILNSPFGLSTLNMLRGISLVTVSAALVFLILWAVVRIFLRGRLQQNEESVSIGTAYGLGSIFLMATLIGLIEELQRPDFGINRYNDIIKFALLALFAATLAGLTGFAVYNILCRIQDNKTLKRCVEIMQLLCAPALLVLTIIIALRRLSTIDARAQLMYLFIAIATLTIIITIAVWIRRGHLTAIVIMLIVAIGPWAIAVFTPTNKNITSHENSGNPKRIILVVVDTLRADTLSCYGSSNVNTPNIDALARDSVVFKAAISPSPWTLPAMASMHTGVAPNVHGTIARESVLPEEIPTLAEHLRNKGFKTTAIGANPFLGKRYGFHRGFNEFYWDQNYAKSIGGSLLQRIYQRENNYDEEKLLQNAKDWIANNRDDSFFLWLHFYTPHIPYMPPPRFMPQSKIDSDNIGMVFRDLDGVRAGKIAQKNSERDWIKTLYEAEVRYSDEIMGRLFNDLKQQGIYDDTLIIFVSDHGEEFWDHGGFEHGHSVYNELLHVPLIIKLPGNKPVLEADSRVCIQDIVPSVFDIFNIPEEDNRFSGKTLQDYWTNPDTLFPSEPIYSTGSLYYSEKECVFFDDMKYIHNLGLESYELYDLANDPHEQNSLTHIRKEDVLRGQSVLNKIKEDANNLREVFGLSSVLKQNKPLSEEEAQALQDMGYL